MPKVDAGNTGGEAINWALWEWALLALMMWREARSEGEIGMRATGHVAWNRHKQTGQPLGVVITKDAQFTSINPYKKTYDSQLDVWPDPANTLFLIAMVIANEILEGTSSDPTNGSTHYWNPQMATSLSFQQCVDEGSLLKTASIGRHDFYREVKI